MAPKRGRLRKKSSADDLAVSYAEQALEVAAELGLLFSSDEDSDYAEETELRALKFKLGQWRTEGQEDIRNVALYCEAEQAACDTERWVGQQLQATQSTARDIRKHRINALLSKMRVRGGEREVSSHTLDTLPKQLCTGPLRNFQALLAAYDMLPPHKSPNYQVIQPDKEPADHTDEFLIKFRFALSVWWLTASPDIVYITLEAEHSHGVAQCTYAVPEDHELEAAIIRAVCAAPLPQSRH